jgi:uncharacterized protein GlcG (DUF336 family)
MELAIPLHTITCTAALAAVQAAVNHGASIDRAVVAAVVGARGDLVAILRGDGAFVPSVEIARDKAYTAAVFGAATDALGQELGYNEVLRDGIAERPGIVLFAGGIPITLNGEVIGAIGVSGGSEDEDLACARAGVAILRIPKDEPA